MASANAPSLKGAHAQRGLCEPWESTTLIRTLPKRAKRQHSDTRENPSLCFQQFTPTPRKHGLAPQGRLRKAQGASPGNKDSNNGSPEGAMQWVPVPKTCLMTSIYLELRPNSLRRPFRAFHNLDLEPRARALGCPA